MTHRFQPQTNPLNPCNRAKSSSPLGEDAWVAHPPNRWKPNKHRQYWFLCIWIMLSNIEYLERGVSILGEISFASRLFNIECVELLASSSIFLLLVICFDLLLINLFSLKISFNILIRFYLYNTYYDIEKEHRVFLMNS